MTGQQRIWCSAGDCITVTESTTHPNVIHIGTQHDGQPGRAQLTVTRGEYEAFVAGIKAEEDERIRAHVTKLKATARRLARKLPPDDPMRMGLEAQDEVMYSVLYAIGGQS
jgi:hypothetical protein